MKTVEHFMQTHMGLSPAYAAAKEAAAQGAPFGAGFAPEVADKVEKLEVWGSSFSEAGDDFCEFRAFDSAGTAIGTKRVAGY